MKINLADTIRAFRKARSLTQQQLADALGVTVGAVYKWEANLSAPDLTLLVELADLFDTSVDVLLGYQVKNNKQADTAARLRECLQNRDTDGLAEAEKALLRYPNCFDIVYQSAKLYYLFGLMSGEKPRLWRSIELMERARLLLGQNTDPNISDFSITYHMAGAYSELGEEEKALELLKSNNPRGINDDVIGQSLAVFCNRPEEAVEVLSTALVSVSAMLIRIANGFVNVYLKRDDYASGASILKLVLDFFAGLKRDGKSNLFDKPCVSFLICLAHAQLKLGKPGDARAALLAAKKLAEEFDRDPDYSSDSLRFVSAVKQQTAFDSLGGTAAETAAKALKSLDNESLSRMWEELTNEE